MTRTNTITFKFVDTIPEKLEQGILYVSMEYATVVHKCCCGCGKEVVTPLTPTDWKLTYDGETVSLYPSIGNWSFACRSHYWIDRNAIHWSDQWSDGQVAAGRMRDRIAKDRYFNKENVPEGKTGRAHGLHTATKTKKSFLAWLKKLWSSQ